MATNRYDHCSVVDRDCEAPAGIRCGSGIADMPCKRILECSICGEPVCRNCSVKHGRQRICNNCLETL